MTARYALYYAPDPASPLGRFGSAWFGRCAISGLELAPPSVAGIDAAILKAALAAPRRYGFHATLKAPFRLAPGTRFAELRHALDRLCARQANFRMPQLEVAELGGFLALVPPDRHARLETLAAACVRGLDRFRAPLSAAELARRRRGAHGEREKMLLQRWGYPYVLDRFRFHLSLTGDLRAAGPAVAAALRRAAEDALRPIAGAPAVVDSVCIFEEPADGAELRLVHRAAFGHRGRLVYLVGPSGAGKDSLLEWVRARLQGNPEVRLARRTITRPAQAGGERHDSVTETQFDAMLARGEFALHWRANGHRYGIGRDIEQWLVEGATVVVNGSREHLSAARAAFPQLEAVHVTAPAEVLQSRLALRGRERPQEMAGRLARSAALSEGAHTAALLLVNDGPIEVAGARLAEFVAGGLLPVRHSAGGRLD